ncbi:MAG: hypothetical protein EZS28_022671 [Streblomastix strix]|uniref:Uncharacterized protein n=1 Tax=Streblomastix strix TaxID=222440 RepID=A0A5J4VH89_9EUKA|nr:MAG: hypothetical protein EZS28_022671 [Streblomastix strix]
MEEEEQELKIEAHQVIEINNSHILIHIHTLMNIRIHIIHIIIGTVIITHMELIMQVAVAAVILEQVIVTIIRIRKEGRIEDQKIQLKMTIKKTMKEKERWKEIKRE